ncbi:MAG: tetratricopeptide repeat protein, partial [Pleurocapsa sp. SU_196_0]|nr:tetratricopeptide repeat protein [Pleurocapsa sp. SU_196_0]
TRSLARLPVFNTGARLALAEVAQARHDFTKALGIVGDVLQLEPRNGSAVSLRASVHFALGQFEAARRDADTLVNAAPNSSNLVLRAAILEAQVPRKPPDGISNAPSRSRMPTTCSPPPAPAPCSDGTGCVSARPTWLEVCSRNPDASRQITRWRRCIWHSSSSTRAGSSAPKNSIVPCAEPPVHRAPTITPHCWAWQRFTPQKLERRRRALG